MKHRTTKALTGAALGLAMTVGAAAAQDYPTQEIRLVLPYSAGGGFDTAARMIAPYMEKYLGEGASIIVDNQPGGGGNVGIAQVQRAAPDGYTIGLINLPGHFAQQVVGNSTYDLFELEMIGNITATTYMLAVGAESPYQTLEDLQAADSVSIGLTGLANPDIYATTDALGITMNPIVHSGSSESILSAIRGDIDALQYPVTSMQSYMDEGDLVPILIHAHERDASFPDVPTMAELGHPEVLNLTIANRILVAAPGTPEPILSALRDAFDQAIEDPDYLRQLEEANITAIPGNWEAVESIREGAYESMLVYEELLRSLN